MLPKSRSNILANGLTNHSSIYFLNPSTSLNSSKGSGIGSSFSIFLMNNPKLASSSDLFVATILVNNSCYLEQIDGADKYNILLNIKNFEKMVKEYESDKSINPIEPQRLQDLVLEIHQSNIK